MGCIISSDVGINKEIDKRLSKADCSFGRLYNHVWYNIGLKNKFLVCRAIVLANLLYGSETWFTYRSHIRRVEHCHQDLCAILNIHCIDCITSIEILEQADISNIESILLKCRLQWAGHIARMEDHRLPKIALYGKLSTGHR